MEEVPLLARAGTELVKCSGTRGDPGQGLDGTLEFGCPSFLRQKRGSAWADFLPV